MELQRGVCILCLEINKIIKPPDNEDFIEMLPAVLGKENLNINEFEKIKSTVKFCPNCCYKIMIAEKVAAKLNENQQTDRKVEDGDEVCHLCKDSDHLMEIDTEWKYFNEIISPFSNIDEWKIVYVCLSCFSYLNFAKQLKHKFFHKFPQTKITLSTPTKSETKSRKSQTPVKTKSESKSSNRRKESKNNCFDTLLPLRKTKFKVEKKLRKDKLLYKSVPYVDLVSTAEQEKKSKIKSEKPKIKIRLKTKHSKKNTTVVKKSKKNGKEPTENGKILDEEEENDDKETEVVETDNIDDSNVRTSDELTKEDIVLDESKTPAKESSDAEDKSNEESNDSSTTEERNLSILTDKIKARSPLHGENQTNDKNEDEKKDETIENIENKEEKNIIPIKSKSSTSIISVSEDEMEKEEEINSKVNGNNKENTEEEQENLPQEIEEKGENEKGEKNKDEDDVEEILDESLLLDSDLEDSSKNVSKNDKSSDKSEGDAIKIDYEQEISKDVLLKELDSVIGESNENNQIDLTSDISSESESAEDDRKRKRPSLDDNTDDNRERKKKKVTFVDDLE